MIKFGVQGGGGDSREKIQPLHITLNRVFKEGNGSYFETIEFLGVYFRVEGPISSFGEEGPDRLGYSKKRKELSVDFVVPENIWKQSNDKDLVTYFSEAIRNCFEVLLKDAMRRGFVSNKEMLVEDFNVKLAEFEGEAWR
ncbi:MAG: hypothetical protein L3J79_05015 [Candidatus Marinimicrobia bacterium]|nr:hypothetical protein [Candidatus Neomarinimicrobiota bacterium]